MWNRDSSAGNVMLNTVNSEMNLKVTNTLVEGRFSQITCNTPTVSACKSKNNAKILPAHFLTLCSPISEKKE